MRMYLFNRFRLLLLVTVGFMGQWTAGAANLVVANNNDTGMGSLRQAIGDNATMGGSNTIIFSNTVASPIMLTSELLISNDVTIIGPGDKVLTISLNHATRAFRMESNAAVRISGLTMANGQNGTQGGEIQQDSGALTLTGCTMTGGIVSGYGGAIYVASGSLVASNCTFSAGSVEISGGAIYQPTGVMILDNCTFWTNEAGFAGGGGIYFSGAPGTIRNCTFSGNHANSGGGLHNAGSALVVNCTFSANSSGNGGGIRNNGTLAVMNTIVAGNTSGTGPDCSGPIVSEGFNLIGKTDASSGWGSTGDQTGTTASPINPLLGPLQDNGGPTMTMALLPGSPAIDEGDSGGIPTDQRGAPRAFDFAAIPNASGGDGSDIGAYELGFPRLGIAKVAGNAVVSWPFAYGGFSLHSETDLTANSWAAVLGSQVVVSNQITVTDGPVVGNKFYRLTSP